MSPHRWLASSPLGSSALAQDSLILTTEVRRLPVARLRGGS